MFVSAVSLRSSCGVSFTMGTDSLLPLLDTRGTAGLALKANNKNLISKQNNPELDSYTQTFLLK